MLIIVHEILSISPLSEGAWSFGFPATSSPAYRIVLGLYCLPQIMQGTVLVSQKKSHHFPQGKNQAGIGLCHYIRTGFLAAARVSCSEHIATLRFSFSPYYHPTLKNYQSIFNRKRYVLDYTEGRLL